MVRRLAGILMMVLGVLQGAWVAYNLWIERLPEFEKPPLVPAFGLATALIVVGYVWLTKKKTEE